MTKLNVSNQQMVGFGQMFGPFSIFLLFQLVNFSPLPGWIEGVSAQTGGNLQVVPTRIIFEGRDRNAEVNLLNQGTTTETYRISFKNMRMLANGDYLNIDEPGDGEKFADSLIRYSPRQVTLKPGEGQTIRLLLRKKRGLEGGEYRSHLLFRTVPPESSGESIEDLSAKEGQISVRLIPIFGISIPVIVRHGKGSASIKISDIQLDRSGGKQLLSFKLDRSGKYSTFGDMEVTLGAGGSDTVVGLIRGIAVYTPNKGRTVQFALDPKADLKGKTLHLVYREIPEKGGDIIAETDVQIP